MINVLHRLSELDAQNPRVERPMVMETPTIGGDGIKQLDIHMPEPDVTALRQLSGLMESREFSNTIAECGMPGMGAPMPSTPASLSMTAGNANEIVTMMRGLADIASGASSAGMPGMGAPMPSSGGMLGDMPAPMDLDHDGEMDGVAMDMGAEPEMGGDEFGGGPMGGDELADMVNKLKTGQPVKISTNMPVKVKTSNPVSGGDEPGADDEDESMAEDMRVWDTSPKETTRDYNPNDFAQMFNKIKDLDVAKAATRADNPLKRESVEQVQPADSLTELTNQLFADYQAFVNEGKGTCCCKTKGEAKCPVHGKMDEARAKEGNAFGKAVRDAKKDGVQPGEKIKVGGKSYPVKEGSTESQMHKDAERMSRKQFCEKYGAGDGAFWDSVNSDTNEGAERTMSRAAKGVMKYGKDGMQALAKAGKDGKNLDKVRDKYNKYD